MDSNILTIIRNFGMDLKRAGDGVNVIPSVQASFYMLGNSLEVMINNLLMTNAMQLLDGVSPKQEQVNLILELTGREREDLSWWAVFDRKDTNTDYHKYIATETFDILSKRAEQIDSFVVNKNGITRKFKLDTKWWTHEVSLTYNIGGYFSISSNKHQFLGEDLNISTVFVKRSYYEDFIRDLKMKSKYDDYAGSVVMHDYVERYTIRNSFTEPWHD